MAYDLEALARRKGIRRKRVTLRPITVRPACVAELRSIYLDMVAVWDGAIARLLATYQPRLILDSAEDTTRLFSLVAFESNRAMTRIQARLRTWAGKWEKQHRDTFAAGVLAATGIDLTTLLGPDAVRETVNATIARNAAQITNISDMTKTKIADAIFRGVQARTPTAEVAREIREVTGWARKRSLVVASDQSTKLYASLDQARQEEAGIAHFIWRHSRKANPRKEHVARNGVLYKWRKGAPDPGRDPPADRPGELPWCGCTAQATLVIDGEVI